MAYLDTNGQEMSKLESYFVSRTLKKKTDVTNVGAEKLKAGKERLEFSIKPHYRNSIQTDYGSLSTKGKK